MRKKKPIAPKQVGEKKPISPVRLHWVSNKKTETRPSQSVPNFGCPELWMSLNDLSNIKQFWTIVDHIGLFGNNIAYKYKVGLE